MSLSYVSLTLILLLYVDEDLNVTVCPNLEAYVNPPLAAGDELEFICTDDLVCLTKPSSAHTVHFFVPFILN